MKTITQSLSPEVHNLLADIFSHAITGELVGMQNYASMVAVTDDWHEKIHALDHAANEKQHALAFKKVAESHGMKVTINPQGPYWKKIGDLFAAYVHEKDEISCILAQEVVFESMAVALYSETGKHLDGPLRDLFLGIAEEEQSHRQNSIDELRIFYLSDPDAFMQKAERVNREIMGTLAEMLAPEDKHGHCGVCNGNCVKGNLHHLKLSITELKGNTLRLYLETLDAIGLPGEITLRWVAAIN